MVGGLQPSKPVTHHDHARKVPRVAVNDTGSFHTRPMTLLRRPDRSGTKGNFDKNNPTTKQIRKLNSQQNNFTKLTSFCRACLQGATHYCATPQRKASHTPPRWQRGSQLRWCHALQWGAAQWLATPRTGALHIFCCSTPGAANCSRLMVQFIHRS
jgi:hypothetical protein